jgi:hypothetical protein
MTADRAIKEPCRVATLGNISLSGLQTVDGVALAASDRVLVRQQATASDNGIWEAAAGAWQRTIDFDGAGEAVGGTQLLVTSGVRNGGTAWKVAGEGPVAIGSDPLPFDPVTLRDTVSILDFGADRTGQSDSTAAFDAAKATGKNIVFPDGTYRGNFVLSTDYQSLIALGSVWLGHWSNGIILTLAGRGQTVLGLRFTGSGYTGDGILITGAECRLYGVTVLSVSGRAVRSTGGATHIDGGQFTTIDTGPSSYDLEFDGGLYNSVVGIKTSQREGGILIENGADATLLGNQFGKLTVQSGTAPSSGLKGWGNRVNGATVWKTAAILWDGNGHADHVTIGDGTSPNLSQICWGPSNVVISGKTFTLNSNVIESSFHLGQVVSGGAAIVVNAPNNDIWHPEISFTPALSASGGSPAIGNGTLVGTYSRAGREWTARVVFQGGTTTNYGTGNFWVTAPFKAATRIVGSANVAEDGVGSYPGVAEVLGGDNRILVTAGVPPVPQTIGAAYPFAWGAGDIIIATVSGQFAP